MWRLKQKGLKYIVAIMMLSIFLGFSSVSAFAYSYDDLSEGTYSVESKLSCYVNAMGGVEFGAPLLKFSEIHVAADGDKTMTLYFTKSSVTIYNITCDTFIDASPSYVTEDKGVKSGTIGIYDGAGKLVTDKVSYTLSGDTAENAQKEQVNYVDSITFPLTHKSDSYNLTLYINSNVMGVQFCNSSGGTSSSYPAILAVDWSTLSSEAQGSESESSEAAVIDKETAVSDKEETVIGKDEKSDEDTSTNVESMDGLNIYYAEEEIDSKEDIDSEEGIATEEVRDEKANYLAYYNMPVIFATGCVAVVIIIIGMVLVIMSKRGGSNE